MEKTSYEELLLNRQNLHKSMEILKANHSGLLTCIPLLKELLEHNEMIEAEIEKRFQELEVKEKELQTLRLDLEERCENFKRVEREVERETDRKKRELALVLQMQSSVRESVKLCNSDLELKEKKVESLKNCVAVCGKEIDSKSKELGEIQKRIEQRTDELSVRQNHRNSIRKLSEELVAKEKKHKEILETIRRSNSEMRERAKEIKAAEAEASKLKLKSERFKQEVEGKGKELNLLKNQVELEEKKLDELKRETEKETDRKKNNLALINSKIEESDKKLATVDELVELQWRRLEIQSMELISKDMELERVAESIKRLEFDIAVNEKKVPALNELITISSVQLDLKSKELVEIEKLIKKQTREVGVMHKRRNSLKLLIQELSEELVVKKKRQKKAICRSSTEIQSIMTGASDLNVNSQRCWRDVEDKEKELDQLKNQIKSEEYELNRIKKSIQDCTLELSSRRDQVEAMKNVQRALEVEKQMTQMSIKHQKQQASSTETEAVLEDVLMHHHHENSTFLQRHEVSNVLRESPNPAEFILELVQGEIREEVDLHDSLVENWVLLFEELAKIQRRHDPPQVQLKAKQVAALWKRKITAMEAPKSSLEVLAFLLFISVYGLEELINEEETTLLASSIAQYEHAPGLFHSFGLKVPEMVVELIMKRQYIQAVQLICAFKLNISPTDLLMKEIIDLKQSALQKRSPTESSQAKEKDAGRLRAILQLIADYKLEIDLPGDLVASLMVQRDNSTHTFLSKPQDKCSNVNLRVPKVEV